MKRLLPLLFVLFIIISSCLVGCDEYIPDVTPPANDTSLCVDGKEHSDADDNGLCDDCGISVIVVLDMFAINDLHGKLCDSNAHAGVDEMTTYIKNAYESEDHVLVLSSGDMWQGSSESNLTKGLIVTEWMNELDFVSMTLGNHEYDWGESFIEQNAELAEFPFLAINIYDSATNKPVEYCQPSVLVERGGATIGVIGAIGDCLSSISGDYSGDVYFKVGSELAELVKAESIRLREAGADFIIYSLHDGSSGRSSDTVTDSQLSSYYSPVLSEGYVDIVFEGHTHRSYVMKDDEGVYHLQNGGDNSGISYAEAEINFANGNSVVRNARYISSRVYDTLEDDPIVAELVKKYDEQVSLATRVLGENDKYRNGDELRQILADLYLQKALEAYGDKYDVVLAGGYMSVRSPGYLPAGSVTFSQIQGIFPFENQLVLCSIKGQDLLSKFINTKNENYFVSYSDYGNSVKNNINPNGTYYILTDSYSSTYAPNRLTEIERYSTGVYAYNLLATFVENGGLGSKGEIVYTPIEEVLNIGSSLPEGKTTDESFYVKGVVANVENEQWGNLYISDEHGNQLYIYGTYDKTGVIRYDAMENPPKVGDEIVLFGQITHYVNNATGEKKIEIKHARLIP